MYRQQRLIWALVGYPAAEARDIVGELALAASKQPIPQNVTLKERKDFRLIGKPWRRLDSARKVDGTIEFGRGGIQQSNFHDYRFLRINETPPVEIAIVDSEASPSGIGEVGTASAVPALANAIFVATGVRIRTLPISRSSLSERGTEKTVMSPGAE